MSVTQLPSAPDILLVDAEFPATPTRLFSYWTQPTLLQQWWPQFAEVEPNVGGSYHFAWPQMEWNLRGRYLAYDPGKRLAFTWRWDHSPSTEPERTVAIDFAALPGTAARLRLAHSPYAATPEDQEFRLEHHLAGWLHFLPRLHEALAATR